MTDVKTFPSRLDLVRAGAEQNQVSRGRLVLGLHRLLEDPRNERRTYAGLEGLVESIKSVGVVEPLTVTPAADNQFIILTGHRRYRAARIAGLTQVEVVVRDWVEEATRRRRSVVSNLQREDVPAIEMAEALQSMLDDDADIRDQKQLAALVGKSPQWVSDMLRILTLPAHLQLRLSRSERPIAADSIAKIARLDDPQRQDELVTALLDGATNRQVRAAVASGASKPKNAPPHRIRYVLDDGMVVTLESARQPLDIAAQRHVLVTLLEKLGKN